MSELSLAGSSYRARRRRVGRVIVVGCAIVAVTALTILVGAGLLIVGRGLADIGGVLARRDQAFTAALWGSVRIATAATAFSILIGVGTTIYVCEVVEDPLAAKRFVAFAQAVAALPAVVFGIIGMQLALFVPIPPMLIAMLTLAMLAVPRIIVTTRDALNSVPSSARLASYALGATRWRTVRDHVLPVAVRNIASGALSTTARTFGATAPLVMLAAITPLPDALPTEAVHAVLFGGRTNTELAGAAIAVIVMLHVAITFAASHLQRRLEGAGS